MTGNKLISVLIADDHGIVREGLRTMLEREGLRMAESFEDVWSRSL